MDIGARLRSSREAQGISLARLSEKTRVHPRILAAIEMNDLSSIPPKPFGRGFIRAYANEVGLDPERTVQEYFGQFPGTPVTAAEPAVSPLIGNERPTWLFPVLAAVVTAGLILFFITTNRRVEGEGVVPLVVGTTGASAAAPVSDPVAAGAASVAPAPVAVAPGELVVIIRTDRSSWINASADGKRVIYRILTAGSEETLRASREISLRAGDAGAVRLTINGRDAGAFGGSGEVRTARITPAEAQKFGAPPARR